MNVERGFRDNISKFININKEFSVCLSTEGLGVYDTCCFGIDASEKMADDRYTIFYNQPSSPENEIIYDSDDHIDTYRIRLEQLPADIAKLVFTVSIDNEGVMSEIHKHTVKIIQNNTIVLEMILDGQSFSNEKAIIDLEIYRKNEWRVGVIARGFNGGLAALVKNYGGEVAEETDDVSIAAESNLLEYTDEQEPEEDLSNDSFADKNIKRYFFIDYENVNKDGLNGILKLTDTDCVKIYYSDNAQTLTFGLHRRMINSKAKFEFSKVNMSIKNAIDCQILFDIKALIKFNRDSSIYIISKDTDFDKPIEEFIKHGINISKLIQICEVYGAVISKTKPNKKVTARVRLDKREQKIKSIYGVYFKSGIYKEKRDQIVKILVKGKTRSQINNELNKIIPSENVSEILKQFKPIISELPGK